MAKQKSANVVTFDPNTGVLLIVGGSGNATVTVRFWSSLGTIAVDAVQLESIAVKKIRVDLSAGKWCLVRFEFLDDAVEDRALHYGLCKGQRFRRRTTFLGKKVSWAINQPMDNGADICVVSVGNDGGTILDLGNPDHVDPDGNLSRQMGHPVEPEFDEDGDRDSWWKIMEKRGTPYQGGGA